MRAAFPQVTAQIPAAIKIVRDYFDGINHEIDTGSENAVSAVIQSSCVDCINQIVNIKALLVNGDTIRGGHVHLLSVDDAFPSYSNIVSVAVHASADASTQLDHNGKVISSGASTPPGRIVFDVLIDHPQFVIGDLAWLGP